MIELQKSLKDISFEIEQHFKNRYGRPPKWIVAAPGRVNIIGEHTDYNDGFVFPMALEMYTVIAADFAKEGLNPSKLDWYCHTINKSAQIQLSKPVPKAPKGVWTNYIAGVLNGYLELGFEIPSLDVFMLSTVPIGSGLSSSAALEVATATLVEAVCGKTIDPVDKALLCQKAENTYAGMPCGIMDQFISVLGKKDNLMLLDCRSRDYQYVPMNDPDVTVLIFNTTVKHKLVGGEYAERRSQCEEAAKVLGVSALRDATMEILESNKSRLSNVVYRRAKHVIEENERTLRCAKAIKDSKWIEAGDLLYQSHNSLKNLFEVSCAELDIVVDIARGIGLEGGVYGCRMTGGGFGGCTVALVKTDLVESVEVTLQKKFFEKTAIKAPVYVSRPAKGAMVIKT